MNVLAVDVMLCVRDLSRSIAFYRDVLGFEVTQDWLWIAAVELAGHRVYLFTESDPTEDKPNTWLFPQVEQGRASLILVLRVDNCQAAYEKILARGGSVLTPPMTPPWGGRRCFLYDPDGYVVELEEPPE
jgi:predicted enzyme related to lactoylglutathione lyase